MLSPFNLRHDRVEMPFGAPSVSIRRRNLCNRAATRHLPHRRTFGYLSWQGGSDRKRSGTIRLRKPGDQKAPMGCLRLNGAA